MILKEAVKRILREDKTKIVFYFCVAISVAFALSILDGSNHAYAQSLTANKTGMSTPILFRELFKEIIYSYSQVISIAIEPFFAILTNAFFGFVNAAFGLPIDMVTTPLSYPLVLISLFILVFIGKVLLSFDSTRIFMLVTYGELEKIVGYMAVLIISVYSTFRVFAFCNENYVRFSEIFGKSQNLFRGNLAPLLGSIFSSVMALLLYYIVKTVVLCGEIMQLPFSFLPGISFLFEAAKSFLVFVLCAINLLFPIAGFLLNCLVVTLGIVLFVKCNYVVEFYRAIYLKPVLHSSGIGKMNKEKIHSKLPQYVKEYFEDNKMLIHTAFPAYVIHTAKSVKNMQQYECWWYVSTFNERYICRRKRFSHEFCIIPIKNFGKMYFKESFRYLEIFTLDGPEQNINKIFQKPKKDLHIAFDHDTLAFYESIIREGEFTDYMKLKEKMKLEENSKRMEQQQTEKENIPLQQAN